LASNHAVAPHHTDSNGLGGMRILRETLRARRRPNWVVTSPTVCERGRTGTRGDRPTYLGDTRELRPIHGYAPIFSAPGRALIHPTRSADSRRRRPFGYAVHGGRFPCAARMGSPRGFQR